MLLVLGFYYQDEPISISRIVDIAVGTHHFTTSGRNGSVPALIIRAKDEADKLSTQAFALNKITSTTLRLALSDD